jgi:hypothetical protein
MSIGGINMNNIDLIEELKEQISERDALIKKFGRLLKYEGEAQALQVPEFRETDDVEELRAQLRERDEFIRSFGEQLKTTNIGVIMVAFFTSYGRNINFDQLKRVVKDHLRYNK